MLCWCPELLVSVCVGKSSSGWASCSEQLLSSLFYRGASFDSSTPARRQKRPWSSLCGFPAMSTALAWPITCSLISAGGVCCSTWLWVRAGLTPDAFQLLGYVSRKSPGRHSVLWLALSSSFVVGHSLASMVWKVVREFYNSKSFC